MILKYKISGPGPGTIICLMTYIAAIGVRSHMAQDVLTLKECFKIFCPWKVKSVVCETILTLAV